MKPSAVLTGTASNADIEISADARGDIGQAIDVLLAGLDELQYRGFHFSVYFHDRRGHGNLLLPGLGRESGVGDGSDVHSTIIMRAAAIVTSGAR